MMVATAVTTALMMILGISTLAFAAGTPASPAPSKTPLKPSVVSMKTSLGEITLELWPDKAPITVKNFLDYVAAEYYDGTIFHRVIPQFMIQGGGLTADMSDKKPTRPPIKNEAGNGLKNTVGTIAMARTGVVDSATSQFFINVKDNPALDHRDETPAGFGYAVFGKVVSGMDVVKKIEGVPTAAKGHHQNVPVDPVVIESVRVKP